MAVQAYHYKVNKWGEAKWEDPASKELEQYTTKTIDTRKFLSEGLTPNHTSDWTLVNAEGKQFGPGEESWKALAQIYGVFSAHAHVPKELVVWETNDGWEGIGWAEVFFNLHGPAPETKTDPDGNKWHGSGPGAFRFVWKGKKDGEVKLHQTCIYSDSTPAVRTMLVNKHIDGQQLAGIITGGGQ